ncbi:hypothetical protein CLV40_11222 [Actinokineospora auranticolor]|uniref:Uncharacterized protein n=1 Tax=Actinokineospora auranticolor TaxID=155976 RepID=A0A2S6GKQ0_9PSEU|nr:hypothetical protein CLV40_11222 [Actinokineospora auranticolor]
MNGQVNNPVDPGSGWRSVVRAGWRRVVSVVGFVAVPLDELVTAWLGVAPVVPRVRWWCQQVACEWRAWRCGVIDAEVVDGEKGVWR